MDYKFGLFVRSRGGYPARALGIENLCLRRTAGGKLLLDVIRQPDVTVRPEQCPTSAELSTYLEQHAKNQRIRQ